MPVTGKRLLSAGGKWILNAAGEADICQSCCGEPTICDCLITDEYYLTCDLVYTEHYDAGDGMTNCDGTATGTELCNETISHEDLYLTNVGGPDCFKQSPSTNFGCYSSNIASGGGVQLDCVDGVWQLNMGSVNMDESDIDGGFLSLYSFRAGSTPVGTWPDITACGNNGTNAFTLTVTNIVITA